MEMEKLDLISLTEKLIAIPSESFQEDEIAGFITDYLEGINHIEVIKINNLVYATVKGRDPLSTLCLAGHIDTVPQNGNAEPRYDSDRLVGLGAVDMKGGVAVMLKLLATITNPSCNLKFIFYPREEVDNKYNGLKELYSLNKDYLSCDAAILLEPTSGYIEAGCQGVIKLNVFIGGIRSHSARPWKGVNAIHRSHAVIRGIDEFVGAEPIVDSLKYRESLQAVLVKGGVATNVVPDEAIITVSYRFAPNNTSDAALEYICDYLNKFLDKSSGDRIEIIDVVDAAAPGITNELIQKVVSNSTGIKPKLGWTDVAFFSKLSIPAINFGPGDASLAHSKEEFVTASDLNKVYNVIYESIK